MRCRHKKLRNACPCQRTDSNAAASELDLSSQQRHLSYCCFGSGVDYKCLGHLRRMVKPWQFTDCHQLTVTFLYTADKSCYPLHQLSASKASVIWCSFGLSWRCDHDSCPWSGTLLWIAVSFCLCVRAPVPLLVFRLLSAGCCPPARRLC